MHDQSILYTSFLALTLPFCCQLTLESAHPKLIQARQDGIETMAEIHWIAFDTKLGDEAWSPLAKVLEPLTVLRLRWQPWLAPDELE